MSLTKTEMMEAVAKIWQMSAEGKAENEIADEMGLDPSIVMALRTQMLEMKADELKAQPVEHTYVEYMLRQLANVHDLTDIIGKLRDTKQYGQAMVGAIRTRADIWDRLMAKGQECSVIKKAPERKEVGVLTLIGELSNSELRREIAESLRKLTDMVTRHGETDFMKLPVPEVLHTGEAVADLETRKKKKGDKKKKKKKMGKSAKAKTSRVSGGRVKERKPSPLKKGEKR
jgi:hypothetical protein